jgi:DNA-directed RNA polymerase subunit K/omega
MDNSDVSEVEDVLDAEEVVEMAESAEEQPAEEEIEVEPVEAEKLEETIYVVPPEKWQTTDILSQFEMTRIITLRATEIEANPGTITIDITGLDDPILIAKRELMLRKCPLLVQREVDTRQVTEGGIKKNVVTVELRNPNEMIFSVLYE